MVLFVWQGLSIPSYSVILISLIILLISLRFAAEAFPISFHRKKYTNVNQRKHVHVIGHRGSREEGLPENTLSAFEDAIMASADVIELDVWLSRDKKVVVFHDEDFARMADGDNRILCETNYEDFPAISPPLRQSERIHKYQDYQWKKIPLLEDVLQITPDNTNVIIEFKQDSDFLIDEVLKIVDRCNKRDSIFWFSLVEKINKKLRLKDSHIPNIVSVNGMLRILFSYYFGILPFMEIQEAVFGITLEEVMIKVLKRT